MAKKFAKLLRIDNDRQISAETDYEFLYQLQSALLLALRERGRLSHMQHRQAQEKLNQQRRERARRKQEGT